MIKKSILLSIFSLLFLIQKTYAMGIDETIEKYFSPFSDKFSEVIFAPITICNAQVPVLIFLMIATSIFCTFYLRCIGIWGFKHSLYSANNK